MGPVLNSGFLSMKQLGELLRIVSAPTGSNHHTGLYDQPVQMTQLSQMAKLAEMTQLKCPARYSNYTTSLNDTSPLLSLHVPKVINLVNNEYTITWPNT